METSKSLGVAARMHSDTTEAGNTLEEGRLGDRLGVTSTMMCQYCDNLSEGGPCLHCF